MAAVKKMIDYVASHAVDPDRIYIEGMSMGGTRRHVTLILTYPYFFASVIPCAVWVPMWYSPLWHALFSPSKAPAHLGLSLQGRPVMPESETAKGRPDHEGQRLRLHQIARAFTAGSMPDSS